MTVKLGKASNSVSLLPEKPLTLESSEVCELTTSIYTGNMHICRSISSMRSAYNATKLAGHKMIGVNDPLWKRPPPRVSERERERQQTHAASARLPIAYTIASKEGGEMAWVIDTG